MRRSSSGHAPPSACSRYSSAGAPTRPCDFTSRSPAGDGTRSVSRCTRSSCADPNAGRDASAPARPDHMTDAIRTESLRKVYPAPAMKKRRGPPPGPFAPPPTAPVRPPGSPATEIVALQGLDLSVRQGEFFGLLGPNGAGKTTTIGILTPRVAPSGGRAVVAGADVVGESVDVRRRIGVVPQRPNP